MTNFFNKGYASLVAALVGIAISCVALSLRINGDLKHPVVFTAFLFCLVIPFPVFFLSFAIGLANVCENTITRSDWIGFRLTVAFVLSAVCGFGLLMILGESI